MDTLSWATKSPPCPVEELPSPLVQRRRSNELCFRKSFRHVNNVSHPASFLIHFPPESLFTSPESLFRIYRNASIHIARNPHASAAAANVGRYITESARLCAR